MMKLSVRFSAFIFFAVFLFGCNLAVLPNIKTPISTSNPVTLPIFSPMPTKIFLPEPTPSSNAIPLEFNNQKVLLEFLQNDSSIPGTNNSNLWDIFLKPEPFTLMVYGNKQIISIMALKSMDMATSFQNLSKPLITVSGTGNMFWEHNLYLLEQPSDIEIDDLASFFKKYMYESDEATELSDYLNAKLSTEPILLMASHTYLGFESGGEQNYSVSKIGNKTIDNYIQSGNSIVLVVFIQKDLGKNLVN